MESLWLKVISQWICLLLQVRLCQQFAVVSSDSIEE